MACITTNGICFRNEIPIILTTCLEIQTYIKGPHVYKDIWIPEIGEQLKVRIEPDNCVASMLFTWKRIKSCWTFKERRIWEVCKNHFLLPEKRSILQLYCYNFREKMQFEKRRRPASPV